MGDTTEPDRWAELGKRVRERRLQLGYSQGRLAEEANVGLNTIKRLESGTPPKSDRHAPSWPAIETALGWPAGFMRGIIDGRSAEVVPLPNDIDEGVGRILRDVMITEVPGATGAEIRRAAEVAAEALREAGLLTPSQ